MLCKSRALKELSRLKTDRNQPWNLSLKNIIYKERLRNLALLSPARKRLRGSVIAAYRYWKESYLRQWSKTMNEIQTLAAGMQWPHAKAQARD